MVKIIRIEKMSTMSELQFLLKCYNSTNVSKEDFLKRVHDLYTTNMISEYAYKHVAIIMGDDND